MIIFSFVLVGVFYVFFQFRQIDNFTLLISLFLMFYYALSILVSAYYRMFWVTLPFWYIVGFKIINRIKFIDSHQNHIQKFD